MKELLLPLLHYNVWANALFIDVLSTLSQEQLDMQIPSSFPSIRKTVYHTWGAEDIWLQRLQEVEKPVWKALNYEGSFEDACISWRKSSLGLVSFAEAINDDEELRKIIAVTSLKGEKYTAPINDIFQHVTNHATYHRGQLVTMFRQAGVTSIPSTDFIAYTRIIEH